MATATAPAAPATRFDLVAQSVSPTRRVVAMPDDDEIVYPISSQSSAASTSPVQAQKDQAAISHHTDCNNETKESTDNVQETVETGKEYAKADTFLEDLILERGDAGSKIWMPTSTVQRARPRGRGHRSTKSESSLPATSAPREPNAVLEPVKESRADDVRGLEEQMGRMKFNGSPVRLSSMTGAEASQAQSPTSTPRKQRSQKKQKGSRRPRGASVPARRSTPNNANAADDIRPSLAPSAKPANSVLSKKGSSVAPESPIKRKPKKGKNKNKAKKDNVTQQPAPSTAPSSPQGLGRRSIVDDVSENGDMIFSQPQTDRLLGVAYDEAVKFMNAFIENPDYYTARASRLTFLQALIVELGLVSAAGPERTLPESLSAAKAMLKSHAFLNVKDYLALREKGLDALRAAMRPSRSALVRDLRGRNGRRAKLNWVKDTGLSVLLVSCQY